MKSFREFKELLESPVGSVGRTGAKDADAYITPELRAEFKKIVKKLGGKTVARKLLQEMNSVPGGLQESKSAQDNKSYTWDAEDLAEVGIDLSKIEDLVFEIRDYVYKNFKTGFRPGSEGKAYYNVMEQLEKADKSFDDWFHSMVGTTSRVSKSGVEHGLLNELRLEYQFQKGDSTKKAEKKLQKFLKTLKQVKG